MRPTKFGRMTFRYAALALAITYIAAGHPVSAQTPDRHDAAQTAGTLVAVDLAALDVALAAAPWRVGESAEGETPDLARTPGQPAVVALPSPTGGVARYALERVATMAPELQARYPDIRSYAGTEVGGSGQTVRADYSPQLGWSFSFGGSRGPRAILSPESGASRGQYRLLLAEEAPASGHRCSLDEPVTAGKPFVGLDADALAAGAAKSGELTAARSGDCRLRRYRLALTCTGEYANAVTTGTATVAGVLAEMVRSVNRLNQIYETDLAISLQLIADNDRIVYLDPATDPYDNSSAGAMLGQAQSTIDARLGSAGYDIGHIYATAGAGLASLGVVCRNGFKARGTTGIANPTGDGFYIDYVAHEIGHQFGATHTFYNSCGGNRSTATGFESGSGATIMAYAGICAPNVAPRSDDYFHSVSLAQIHAYVITGAGSCAQLAPVTNQAPVLVGAGTITQHYIPVSTRFELALDASDPDGDTLTYTWEQWDGGGADPQPPLSSNVNGPLFRPVPPSLDPRRRFPSAPGLTFEVLPSVERELNFRGTVRDNHHRYGCTAERDVRIQTVHSAPFAITSPNSAMTVTGFQRVPLKWEVGATTLAPISTPLVDIFFSRDGGVTYTDTIALGAPNTGQANVAIPNVSTTRGRLVVRGHDNVFFDINDADITVTATANPTFVLTATPLSLRLCRGETATVAIAVESVLGFAAPVSLALGPLPAGVTATIAGGNGQGAFTATLTIVAGPAAALGNSVITVTGTGGGVTRTLELPLLGGAPPTAITQAISPLDGADDGLAVTTFRFGYVPTEGPVRFQLSTDPTFQTGVSTALFTRGEVSATGLGAGVYYWRVAYENDCGRGPWSELQSFRRLRLVEVPYANTTPVAIQTGPPGTYTSQITATRPGDIYRVEVDVDVTHTYVGDLSATLTMPGAPARALFARPGGGSCAGEDLAVTFADDALRSAQDFVSTCGVSTSPSIEGTFRPSSPFLAQLPRPGNGTYTLTIVDNAAADGGQLDRWDLRLWYLDQPQVNAAFTADTLRLRQNAVATVGTTSLGATATGVTTSQTRYVVKTLPNLGELRLNGVALAVGATFTQADVDAGRISYHSTGAPGVDRVVVDLLLDPFGYFPDRVLAIRITRDDLAVTAATTSAITCAASATGAIAATATGGTAPYTYSLNGGSFQSSRTFGGLPAGTYTVRVRDADGTIREASAVTLADPPALTVVAASNANTVTATAQGGTGAITYSIDGVNFQTSATFAGLADGTYTLTVRDANGCSASTPVVVNTVRLTATLSLATPIRCAGQTATLQASAAGGPAPYSYSLNGGTPQSSPTFTGIRAGTYTLTVTDASGAQASSGAVVVTAPAPLTLSATVDARSVTAVAQGGTSPYTYSIDGFNFVSGARFDGLANGSYTVTVRDANGCTSSTTVQVLVNTLVVSLRQSSPVSCAGAADATVVASATGGRAPYTYSLNGGTPRADPTFAGLAAGTYTVTVADADGLTRTTNSVAVVAPQPLSATATALGSDVSVTAAGGTAPYTYTRAGGTPQNSNVFTGLSAGTYTFTVRDSRGCTTTATATIVADALALRVDLITGTETCPGADDGAVALMGVNGVPPYMYSLDGSEFVSVSSFSGLAPGAYTGYVRDASGTIATTTFAIGARQQPTADIQVNGSLIEVLDFSGASSGVTYSFDGGVTFGNEPRGYRYAAGPVDIVVRYGTCTYRAVAEVTDPLGLSATDVTVCSGDTTATTAICVRGGVMAYAITSSAGVPLPESIAGCPAGFQIRVPAVAGTYSVGVTDQTGATRRVDFRVRVAPIFTLSVVRDGTDLLAAVDGGEGPFTFSIDGGATTQASGRFEGLADGSYTVTATDANGCSQTLTFQLSALADVGAAIGLQVFPNPAHGTVQVRVDRPDLLHALRIYSAIGQRMREQAPATEFDLHGLAPGYYLLEVDHAAGRAHVPLVVE